MTPVVALALRTYARYAAPLTLLAVVLFAPLLAYGLLSKVPTGLGPAWRMVMVAWAAAGTAWIAQYMVVGAAAPLVRSVAAGAPLSQLAAPGACVRGFARAVLPILIVVAAIVLGSIALAIPGLVLGVLLSLTGASREDGLSKPLLDSTAMVKRRLKVTVIAIVAILAIDFAVVVLPFVLMLGPLSPRPTPDELVTARRVLQIVAIGLPIVTPLAACLLAAIATTARPSA